MIDQAFYNYLVNDLSINNLYYGSAENQTPPYTVMFKVDDLENRLILCENQGESGEALFQFNGYAGREGNPADAAETITYLETIKNQVLGIKGTIGSPPNDYRINWNITTGVRIISDASNSLSAWGAIFETTLRWVKL